MRYSTKAWIAVLSVIGVVEAKAPENETLSDGCYRALGHPLGKVIVPFVVIQVALHLLKRLPARVDMIHLGFAASKAMLSRGKIVT